jgi:uncharacterized protein YaeQ
MALGDTIYVFDIELANSDSGVYESLMLRIARHQSETAERNLTGVLKAWIDVGAPESPRLHRASKAAPRVAVYTHKDAVQLAARLGAERIHRIDALELYAMDFDWLSDLSQRLQRRTAFTLTVSEQHLYLSLGEETLSAAIKRIPVGQ